jgi:hypothetical protein
MTRGGESQGEDDERPRGHVDASHAWQFGTKLRR